MSAALRVALVLPHPGDPARPPAEPLVAGLAEALSGLGHDTRVLDQSWGRVAPLVDALLSRRGFTGPLSPLLPTVAAMLGGDFDVVHAFSAPGALAARVWRARQGGPVVFTCAEKIDRDRVADRRLRLALLTKALEDSDAVIVPDEQRRAALERWLAADPLVIPPDDGSGHAGVYRRLIADSDGGQPLTAPAG